MVTLTSNRKVSVLFIVFTDIYIYRQKRGEGYVWYHTWELWGLVEPSEFVTGFEKSAGWLRMLQIVMDAGMLNIDSGHWFLKELEYQVVWGGFCLWFTWAHPKVVSCFDETCWESHQPIKISNTSKFSGWVKVSLWVPLVNLLMQLILIGCWINYPQFFKGSLGLTLFLIRN